MEIDGIRDVFMWCTIINVCILFFWFVIIAIAGGGIHRLHSRWIPLSKDAFNAIHYGGIMFFKMLIFAFNFVPYIAR